MEINKLKFASLRSLIDKYFSLQWCRDNLVVPISVEPGLPPTPGIITIAVANIVFLGTIGQRIKERLKDSGFNCKYIEIPSEEIQQIIDLVVE